VTIYVDLRMPPAEVSNTPVLAIEDVTIEALLAVVRHFLSMGVPTGIRAAVPGWLVQIQIQAEQRRQQIVAEVPSSPAPCRRQHFFLQQLEKGLLRIQRRGHELPRPNALSRRRLHSGYAPRARRAVGLHDHVSNRRRGLHMHRDGAHRQPRRRRGGRRSQPVPTQVRVRRDPATRACAQRRGPRASHSTNSRPLTNKSSKSSESCLSRAFE